MTSLSHDGICNLIFHQNVCSSQWIFWTLILPTWIFWPFFHIIKRTFTCGTNHQQLGSDFILRHISLNEFLTIARLSKECGVYVEKHSRKAPSSNWLMLRQVNGYQWNEWHLTHPFPDSTWLESRYCDSSYLDREKTCQVSTEFGK